MKRGPTLIASLLVAALSVALFVPVQVGFTGSAPGAPARGPCPAVPRSIPPYGGFSYARLPQVVVGNLSASYVNLDNASYYVYPHFFYNHTSQKYQQNGTGHWSLRGVTNRTAAVELTRASIHSGNATLEAGFFLYYVNRTLDSYLTVRDLRVTTTNHNATTRAVDVKIGVVTLKVGPQLAADSRGRAYFALYPFYVPLFPVQASFTNFEAVLYFNCATGKLGWAAGASITPAQAASAATSLVRPW